MTLAIEVNFESLHTVLESGVEERNFWANISISLGVRHWICIKSNHLIEENSTSTDTKTFCRVWSVPRTI